MNACFGLINVLKCEQPEGGNLQAALTIIKSCEDSTMADSQSTMPVEYRAIPGFPGYRVGSDGSVWTCRVTGGNGNPIGHVSDVWRIRKSRVGSNGYLCIVLRRDNRRFERMVHTLVLEAFVGPRPRGMECRHYPDATKTNVALSNLQWGTSCENKRDRFPGRATATHKRCASCGTEKPIDEFIQRSSSLDGHSCWCRECHRRHARQWRAAKRKERRLF